MLRGGLSEGVIIQTQLWQGELSQATAGRCHPSCTCLTHTRPKLISRISPLQKRSSHKGIAEESAKALTARTPPFDFCIKTHENLTGCIDVDPSWHTPTEGLDADQKISCACYRRYAINAFLDTHKLFSNFVYNPVHQHIT